MQPFHTQEIETIKCIASQVLQQYLGNKASFQTARYQKPDKVAKENLPSAHGHTATCYSLPNMIVTEREWVFLQKEKEKRSEELISQLVSENGKKEKLLANLILVNKVLVFQKEDMDKKLAQLTIANRKLKKIVNQFEKVIESAPNAMILISTDGIITLANPQASIIFGYDGTELLGEKFDILVPERYQGQGIEHYFSSERGNIMVKKNGFEIQTETSLSLIETEQGLMTLLSIINSARKKPIKPKNQNLLPSNSVSKELEELAFSMV